MPLPPTGRTLGATGHAWKEMGLPEAGGGGDSSLYRLRGTQLGLAGAGGGHPDNDPPQPRACVQAVQRGTGGDHGPTLQSPAATQRRPLL